MMNLDYSLSDELDSSDELNSINELNSIFRKLLRKKYMFIYPIFYVVSRAQFYLGKLRLIFQYYVSNSIKHPRQRF